jgi:exopolysaccharide biosynthesis polyprenyl glycosylphosphotransferase
MESSAERAQGVSPSTVSIGALFGRRDSRPRWWRDRRRRRLLALADVGAACVAATVAVAVTSEPGWALATAPLWVLFAKVLGLYDVDHKSIRHLTVDEASKIAGLAALGSALLFLMASWQPGQESLTLPKLGAVYIAAFLADLVLRGTARSFWRHITPPERTAIFGDGLLAETIQRKVELFPDMHLELIASPLRQIASPLRQNGAEPVDEALGQQLHELLERVDRLILATDSPEPSEIADLTRSCRDHQVKLSVVSPFVGNALPAPRLSQIAELQMLEYGTWDVSRSTVLLKRTLDLSLSAIALVALAPVFLLIAIAIKLDTRGPAFFKQRRAGLRGAPFTMLKFRSMTANAEERLSELIELDQLNEPVFKLRDDPRVTRVGRWLRRTSLDELPQFLNVLKGEMSLVGPRPEELSIVDRYRREHLFRLELKPGITGPMQVCGRGELTFPERLVVERDYLEHQSMTRDLRILAITASIAFRGTGAY